MSVGLHNPGGAGGGGAGTLTVKTIDATGQAAGNLNLTDAAWAIDKAKLDYIEVTVSSGTVTDFDIAIYEDDTFSGNPRYNATGLNSTDNWRDDQEWIYVDDDASNELHLQITENAGTGSYDIHIRGVELA